MPSAWTKPSRYQNRQDEPQLTDLLPIKKFKPGQFYELRPIGAPYTFAVHWLKLWKKDGSATYNKRKLCLGYDDASGEFKGGCPYCEDVGSPGRIETLQNMIDRKIERAAPRDLPNPLKSEKVLQDIVNDAGQYYIKQKDSESWTPVEPVRLPTSPCQDIGNMVGTNTRPDKHGEEIPRPPEDPKYGFDIKLKHDPKAVPAKQYYVEKAGNTKLSDDQLDYLVYKLDVETPETLAEATKWVSTFEKYFANEEKDGETEGETSKASAKGGERRKPAGGHLADLDADEDAGDPNAFDPDEDDTPRRKPRGRDTAVVDDDADERPATRRRAETSVDDEDEKPARKPRRASDDDDEEVRPRGRSASLTVDDDEEDKPRRTTSKRQRTNDDDEERPAQRKPARRTDPDDEERPADSARRAKRSNDDDDEATPPRSSGRRRGPPSRNDDDDDGLDLP